MPSGENILIDLPIKKEKALSRKEYFEIKDGDSVQQQTSCFIRTFIRTLKISRMNRSKN